MRHSTISQLLALGYNFGDRVTGRNLSIHGKNISWSGILTPDNIIQIQEYTYHPKTKTFELDGIIHEDGLSWLHRENNQDKNIYFNVNGGRINAEVKSWKAIFFEEDYGTFEEQQAKIDAIPLKPSFQLQTRKSNHCYFTIHAEEARDLEQWKKLQSTIAYVMGSDPSVKDLPRLMRLSGFDHVKLNQERVNCFTKYINPDNVYSIKEVVDAVNIYAENNGIKPYSEERFRAYQYIINRLRQTKHDYQHELFDPNFFRTCGESEFDERLQRCRLYARSIEKNDPNPETAWTKELKEVREKVKEEYDFPRIPATVNEDEEPLTVQWARNLEGFEERGRGEWHTAKCPVHGGFSLDSLHIHILSGRLKCHSGCDSAEITTKLSQIAKDKGDERWNWELWNKDNLEVSNAQLNTEIFLYKKATSLDFEKLEELGIKVTKINTKLLTPDDLNIEKGKITFIISPKGTGKTQASGEALKDYAAVHSVHHRISLARSICKTLGVTYYDDWVKNRNKHRVSFCAQRLPLLNPGNLRDNGVLFVDECNQVFDFCLSKLCNSDNKRPLILNALQDQLQAALVGGVALFMSADITMKEVMLIHSLALPNTPIEIVINEYQPEQGIVNFSNDKKPDGLAAKLIETLRDKKPCFVVDDFKNSYRGGKTLAEILQAEMPDIKLQIIHADNSGSPEVRQFLDNVNVESLETDVIIVSPSVTSGLSIENGRFKHCFAIINGILSDDQVLQSINRPRGCENFYIWAADKGLLTEAGGAITPEEVHNFYLRNYDARNAHFLSYGNRYDAIDNEWKSPFWTLYCENVALNNLVYRRLNFWIKDRLIGEGYTVVDHEFGDNKDLVKEQKIAWKKISIAEAVVIGNAKLNNEDEQKKLSAKIEAGVNLLPEELASFRKTHIHETFGEEYINACVKEIEVNKETLEKATLTGYAAVAYQNQNGKLEQGLKRYYKFFKRPIEDCIESDIKRDKEQRKGSNEYDGFLFPGDIRWTTREHKFWEGINFREYLQPERRWQGWELAQIIARIQPNIQQTKDCIGIDFSRGDLKKSYGKGFRELCERLGLAVVRERTSDGDRFYTHHITSKSLEMAEMFASHQEHRRLLKEELKSVPTPDLYSNSVYLGGIGTAETPTVRHFQQQPVINTPTPPPAQNLVNLEILEVGTEKIHPLLDIGEAYRLKEDCIAEVNSVDELRDWIKRHSLTLTLFEENILTKIKSPNLIKDFLQDWVRVLRTQ